MLCMCFTYACVHTCRFLKGLLFQPPIPRTSECLTDELRNGKGVRDPRREEGGCSFCLQQGSPALTLTSRQGARKAPNPHCLTLSPFLASVVICKMEALTWWSPSTLAAAFELLLSRRK